MGGDVVTVVNRIREGDGDPRHGTRNGYTNHGCRCRSCTTANSEAVKQYMWRSGRADPLPEYQRYLNARPSLVVLGGRRTHGIPGTYFAGCRCRPCRNANAAHQRAWREQKRVTA